MTTLTDSQLRALRWLRDNPSDHAEWTVNGKPIRRQPPDEWNVFVISGRTGSIKITAEDNAALRPYKIGCPSADKIFGPNEAGLAVLAAAEKAGVA